MLIGCGNTVLHTENTNRQKEKIELSLSMKRSGCYGRCPIYDLTVQPDGKVLFEGKFWTEIIGKAEDKLTEEQLKLLTAEIEKADFLSFDDDYGFKSKNCPNIATDNASVTLNIKLNGREKTINHYLGCLENDKPNIQTNDNSAIRKAEDLSEIVFPQSLYNLENKIDEIVETKRWIEEQE